MARYIRKITIRLTQQEYSDIEKKAAALHVDISKYVRRTILDNPYEKPELIKECQNLSYEINKIGNNINQIAHLHNSNLYNPEDIDNLLQMMSFIRRLIMDFRKRILKKGD